MESYNIIQSRACIHCNHPTKRYSSDPKIIMHVKKDCEYSIVCWLCECKTPEDGLDKKHIKALCKLVKRRK